MTTTFRGKLLGALALVALVTGCAETGMGTKQGVGTLGGALGGAVIGSQFGGGDGQIAATAIGTLLGAMVGNSIGASLDKADQAAAGGAFNQAYTAPVGQTVRWNNPNSGNQGAITTTRDGYSSAGNYCREFQQTITVGGRTQQAYGTACQNADGTWQVVQ